MDLQYVNERYPHSLIYIPPTPDASLMRLPVTRGNHWSSQIPSTISTLGLLLRDYALHRLQPFPFHITRLPARYDGG